MSKQSELAALFIGAGMGMDDVRIDLTEDMSFESTIEYYAEAAYYAPIAAAMVEAAHDVTFQYPPNWQWEIYHSFGETLNDNSEIISPNEDLDEDDDDYDKDAEDMIKHADRATMLDELQQYIINEFSAISPAQQQNITAAVIQARTDAA